MRLSSIRASACPAGEAFAGWRRRLASHLLAPGTGAGDGYKANVWVSSDGSRVVVLLLNGRMADRAIGDLRAASTP